MRLLQSEYEDLRRILQAAGLNPDMMVTTKKSGWLRVGMPGRETPFSFHRRKEVKLVKGQFQDVVRYRIKKDGKTLEMEGWPQVLRAFTDWVQG